MKDEDFGLGSTGLTTMYLFVVFAILGYIILGLMISTGGGERVFLIGLLMIIMFLPYVLSYFWSFGVDTFESCLNDI